MSTMQVTCLIVSCDRCGSKLGEHSYDSIVHIPVDSAPEDSDVFTEEEWKKIGDRHLCPNCWTYGEPPDDDPAAEVFVELPHPLSGRVGS